MRAATLSGCPMTLAGFSCRSYGVCCARRRQADQAAASFGSRCSPVSLEGGGGTCAASKPSAHPASHRRPLISSDARQFAPCMWIPSIYHDQQSTHIPRRRRRLRCKQSSARNSSTDPRTGVERPPKESNDKAVKHGKASEEQPASAADGEEEPRAAPAGDDAPRGGTREEGPHGR